MLHVHCLFLNVGHLLQFIVEETEAQRTKWVVLGDTARKEKAKV